MNSMLCLQTNIHRVPVTLGISKGWADPDLLLFAAIGSHSVEWAEVYFASRTPALYVTVRMMTMTMTMTMMMVYLTHITGSTVLCVCQHHFELLHTSSTVYHLFSFSMFLQMSLTNMHICFIAFSFVSLLLFGSTLSICLIFSSSVVSLKLLT